MTAQGSERILYKGEQREMGSEPLWPFLQTRTDIRFIPISTDCHRGYWSSWAIKEDQLYLTSLSGLIKGHGRIEMDYVFPGKEEVFADWYTGELRLYMGELLEYVHNGYASTYEKDLLLTIKDGIVMDERMVDNTIDFEPSPFGRQLHKWPVVEPPVKKTSFWDRLFRK